jgi:hypothetical protein
MKLADQIIELMQSCEQFVGEYDQRSALGIADAYVRGSLVEFPSAKYDGAVPRNRDALAQSIVAMVGETSKEENKEALRTARAWLNAPYVNDFEILKWRAKRAADGERAKGSEAGR